MLGKQVCPRADSHQEPEGEPRLTFQGNGLAPPGAVVALVEGTRLVNILYLLGGCNNHSVERGVIKSPLNV